MRKLLFAVFTISLLFSCEDPVVGPGFPDNYDPNNPNSGNPTTDTPTTDTNNQDASNFQVDFDNQTYIADNVTASVISGFINITAMRGSNNEIVVMTINANSTGTYSFGFATDPPNGAAYTTTNGSEAYVAGAQNTSISAGEVTITEINTTDKLISGTFHFSASKYEFDASGNPILDTNGDFKFDTKEFTNGSFTNIAYSDDLGDNNNPTSGNSFFAEVDGNEFSEDMLQAVKLSLGNISFLTINATKNSLETVGIAVPGDITVGTYELSSFGDYRGLYNLNATDSFGANPGTITIVSHDTSSNIIKATFEFTATSPLGDGDSYIISGGEFEVTYTE